MSPKPTRISLGVAFVALLLFSSDIESAPCPASVTQISVSSPDDVQALRDALYCTGSGTFEVNWSGTVAVEQVIEVTGGSHLVVVQDPTDDLDDVAVIDGGNSSGIFHVSGRSMLTLVNLVLRGGRSDRGGAIEVDSSSSLDVDVNRVTALDCVFMSNYASRGGESLSVSMIVRSPDRTAQIACTAVLALVANNDR